MEHLTSGNELPLLTTFRALARRGALLQREADGGGLVVHAPAKDPAGAPRRVSSGQARMTPEDMLRAFDRGWLKQSGAEQFILSKRGTAMLRAALNRASAAKAASAVETGATAGPRPPSLEAAVVRARPQVNASESPLAWLRNHHDKDGSPLISAQEFEAGERLRADFHTAQMTPRVTASWDATLPGKRQPRGVPGAGLDVSEAAVAARQRIERAVQAVGPRKAGVLIDVCCLLLGVEQAERNGGWPRRAGKVVLQLALESLARHYGLIAPLDSGRPARPRHWGAAGYRPTVDGGNPGGNPT